MKRVIVHIYNSDGKVILTHIFYGKTRSEALDKTVVHMKFDTFFKDVIRGRYKEYQAFLYTPEDGWVKVRY